MMRKKIDTFIIEWGSDIGFGEFLYYINKDNICCVDTEMMGIEYAKKVLKASGNICQYIQKKDLIKKVEEKR